MPAKRCAYLTMDSAEGWSIDAELCLPPLGALGWQVDAIPWRSEVADWDEFDAVYIGVPWDYPEDPERFLSVLESIDRSRAILVNDLSLVHWSMPKTYLRDLERRGAAIVPSLWYEDMEIEYLEDAFIAHETDRIIVKPVVSTNATDTFLLTREDVRELERNLLTTFSNRPFVVQPFIDSILREGEYSLFYFNRQFSHAIQKIPASKDFRVQEEHGVEIAPVAPSAALLETGNHVMSLVHPLPAYARVDLVRGSDDRFLVMELELIEPSMYLRTDADAPRRFAEAFDDYVNKVSAGEQP